jgi:hypothetical protein
MTPRFDAGANVEAVLTSIGTALRVLRSMALREPIPDGMAELLKQLDQPKKDDGPASTC